MASPERPTLPSLQSRSLTPPPSPTVHFWGSSAPRGLPLALIRASRAARGGAAEGPGSGRQGLSIGEQPTRPRAEGDGAAAKARGRRGGPAEPGVGGGAVIFIGEKGKGFKGRLQPSRSHTSSAPAYLLGGVLMMRADIFGGAAGPTPSAGPSPLRRAVHSPCLVGASLSTRLCLPSCSSPARPPPTPPGRPHPYPRLPPVAPGERRRLGPGLCCARARRGRPRATCASMKPPRSSPPGWSLWGGAERTPRTR